MKKMRKKLSIVLMIIFLFGLSMTAYAAEGDYSYYGYDESGGIYDFSLLEENAQIFEDSTGITPFVLVTSYLGDTTAKDFAKEFYNDSNNYEDIFSQADYFILIISDEEEVMDLFVSEEASSTLTNSIVSTLLERYRNKVDNTEYHDILIFDILTDAQDMILSAKTVHNTADFTVKEHQPINTMEVENSKPASNNSSSLIILIFIVIIVAAIIITYMALSFIHKRMKAEEEHELNMEKLYHKSPSTSDEIVTNRIQTEERSDTSDEIIEDVSKSDDERRVNSTSIHNSSSTVNNITNIYDSTPRMGIVTPIYRRPFISQAPVPPPPHHAHHEHSDHHDHHEGTRPSPKRATPPTTSSISKGSSMTRPSTPPKRVTTSSVKKSSSSMKRPVTPARSPRPSGGSMRKPSTPARRGR